MTIYISGHSFGYELFNVARMFFHDVKVEEKAPSKDDKGNDFAYLRRVKTDKAITLMCTVKCETQQTASIKRLSPSEADAECENSLACMLYDILCVLTGRIPSWGVITGIRPAKYVSSLLDEGSSEGEVMWRLMSRHRVSEDKARLCIDTARVSRDVERQNKDSSCSLYVSIPFCPSRCSYCSFISSAVKNNEKLIEPYIEKLCEEIEQTAKVIKELDLSLETVYIGGGTPTVLNETELKRLTDAIEKNIDIKSVKEFSVEAGRPDTITAEKLLILKNAGVTRLSINPQTANDEVLRLIGRRHTAKDIERAFFQARQAGFDNINADLIAGLTGDDFESFKRSLEWIEGLKPENITVHALTLKRASRMTKGGLLPCFDAAKMVDYAGRKLREDGYEPYYMYKQKGTVDSLENTGYSKEGKRCLYNVFIMEELHTILACGAGAVTKLVDRRRDRVERIYNYKYPTEYIDGFDEIIRRKKGVLKFYGR